MQQSGANWIAEAGRMYENIQLFYRWFVKNCKEPLYSLQNNEIQLAFIVCVASVTCRLSQFDWLLCINPKN